jgi:FkbM family methyltransferase
MGLDSRIHARKVGLESFFKKFGFFKTIQYLWLRLLSKILRLPYFSINLKPYKFPIYIRGNASDNAVFYQIFLEEEYSSLNDIKGVNFIIDCGAYVGYSSIWFLNKFPLARITAVEPDTENLDICKKNLAPYGGRISVFHSAVWPYKTGLTLRRGEFEDGRHWTTQVKEVSEREKADVEALDIATLIEKSGFEVADLLKIDIERAEIELFSRNFEKWLNKTKNIAIELHDRECEKVFFKALSGYDYEMSKKGELIVCKNIRPKGSG